MSHRKWIISDLHLGHKNILKYSGPLRGGTTGEEHDEWLRHQWNSVVGKNDLVFVVGDVAMGKEHLEQLKRFKGQKQLILGNHDPYETKSYLEYFAKCYGLHSYKGTFWISHAPIHPQELRGRFNIHGHVHQNSILGPDGLPDPRYINVCVEMSYGIPQDLDALLAKYQPIVQEARALIKAQEDSESTQSEP